MIALAIVVFIALFHVKAGYGYLANGKWGPKINNKLGWVLMESPVFLLMLYMFLDSPRSTFEKENIIYFALSAPFFIHYFQRSFIFPFLIKGNGRMPVAIILMGVVFNCINAYLQGEWLYYLSPSGYYTNEWLTDPRFIIGALTFIAGFYINLQSDYIIRHLRKPGDTKHYIPKGGMSNTYARPIISGNSPNGSVSQSSHGLFREPCSHFGPLPTSVPVQNP